VEFLAQNNLSITSGDNIINFFKDNISDSIVLKNSAIYRKKTGLLLNEGIKDLILEDLDKKLEGKFWSLLVDECTDKTMTKFLALIVQYWDPKEGQKCHLYRLIKCSEDSKSEQIYDLIYSVILTKPFSEAL